MRALGLILALLSLPLHSQDERVVKKMIENIRETNQESPSKHSFFNAHSPLYKLDINDDGRVESIVLEKKDNEDWIHIHDYKRRRFFSAPFVPKGTRSGVYKINRRVISKDTYVLLIHYYEGYTRYLRLQGTARLYHSDSKKRPHLVGHGKRPHYLVRKRGSNTDTTTGEVTRYILKTSTMTEFVK